jgi:hypothetical protein
VLTISRPPNRQPFRFMDLPVELRLQISEYAFFDPAFFLKWKWTTFNNNKCVGTFSDINSITPLRLVSHQLHFETSGLIWKLDTFTFVGEIIHNILDPPSRHDPLSTRTCSSSATLAPSQLAFSARSFSNRNTWAKRTICTCARSLCKKNSSSTRPNT